MAQSFAIFPLTKLASGAVASLWHVTNTSASDSPLKRYCTLGCPERAAPVAAWRTNYPPNYKQIYVVKKQGPRPARAYLSSGMLAMSPARAYLSPCKLGISPARAYLSLGKLGISPGKLGISPARAYLSLGKLGISPDKLGISPAGLI